MEFESYPAISTVEHFTISVDFPCEVGVTYTVTSEDENRPLNGSYTIGDEMMIETINYTFQSVPDASISSICWSYEVTLLTGLPGDD